MSAVLEIQKTNFKTEVFQNGQILDARLISVMEYDKMIEFGILTIEDKVELLNGVINDRHILQKFIKRRCCRSAKTG